MRLAWKGATSPNVDIYRNSGLIATQPKEARSPKMPLPVTPLNRPVPPVIV